MRMKYLIAATFTLCSPIAPLAMAHFPWLAVDKDGHAMMFFGEGLQDRTYHLPDSIAKSELVWHASGASEKLELTQVDQEGFVGLKSKGPLKSAGLLTMNVIYGDYQGMKLIYYAQCSSGDVKLGSQEPVKGQKLQALVQLQADGGASCQILWDGKPLADADVTLYCEAGHEEGKSKTDTKGIVLFSPQQVEEGLNAILVGYKVTEGEGQNVKAKEAHYLTATFTATATASSASLQPGSLLPGRLHRSLKEPLTSFGAAVLGDYLYVFSGHDGDAHGFGKDLLSKHFRRIRFDDPQAEWEDLPMHAPAQSVAIVTDGKHLYRIGGLSFLNESGDEETNYNSTTHFARYDVDSRTWTDLTPLPEPRSSLDAALLGRHIYVAGGWNLQGSSSDTAPWTETMLRYDLDHPEAGWETLPGPGYKSRAISLAAHENKLYFIGGISERGILRKVSVWDAEKSTWSVGPELPADNSTAGFATSSFATGGHLYVAGGSGVIYRLNAGGDAWEVANRMFFPRMFLRLVPADSHRLLAVGGTGASGAGRMSVVESVNVDPHFDQPHKLATWSIDFGGRAKHSQSLALVGSKLYAFGGNASRRPHDFSQAAFVDEAFAFDITDRSVETLPKLPVPMQSGVAVVNRQTSEHQTIAVAGGIGFDSSMTSLDAVHLFDPSAKTWTTTKQKLPEPRSMFEAVTDSEAIWSFGGASGTGSALLTNVLHWWGDESAISALPNVSLPTSRRSFATAQIGRELFLIGGLGEGNAIAAQVDVFDFDKRTWRTAASPVSNRVFPSAAVADGKIYLFGGFSMAAGHFAAASALEVYDPAQDKWEVVAQALPDVPASMRMLAFSNRLLFFGVDKEQDGRANFVLFDPDPLATPTQVASMSFDRQPRARDDSAETARMLIRRDLDKDGRLNRDELGSKLAHLLAGDQDGDSALSMAELITKLKADAETKQSAEPSEPQEQTTNSTNSR